MDLGLGGDTQTHFVHDDDDDDDDDGVVHELVMDRGL